MRLENSKSYTGETKEESQTHKEKEIRKTIADK
jgi:hypothetical protein